MIKAKDLISKDIDELGRTLAEARTEFFRLRTDVSKQKIKNVRVLKNKRIEIARILTVIGQKTAGKVEG